MIQHYGLWKRPDRAEELFLEMKTRNIHPNEDTFVALMGALTKVRPEVFRGLQIELSLLSWSQKAVSKMLEYARRISI